jgi:hypothetical protein
MNVLDRTELAKIAGGSYTGSYGYTWFTASEHDSMIAEGNWTGGLVQDLGYVGSDFTVQASDTGFSDSESVLWGSDYVSTLGSDVAMLGSDDAASSDGGEGYFPDALYSRDANKGDVYVSNKDVVDVFSLSAQPVAGTVSMWGVAFYELIAGSASKIPNGASAPIIAVQITLQIEDWTRNAILRDYNANGGGQGMIMNYRESIQDMNGYLHVARSMSLIDVVNGRKYGTFNQNYLPRK